MKVIASLNLCNILGLDGQDEWESAKAEELVQAINDVRQQVRFWRKEQDETKKVRIISVILNSLARSSLLMRNTRLFCI